MTSDRVILGAIIFFALVIGANLAMYAIARGAKGDASSSRWLKAAQDAFRDPFKTENSAADELHRQVEKLSKTDKSRDDEGK